MSVTPEILWAPPTDYDHSHLIRACQDDMDYWDMMHVCYDFKLYTATQRFDTCATALNFAIGGDGANKAAQIAYWTEQVGMAEAALQRLLNITPSEHWTAWREDMRQDWRNNLEAPGFLQMWRVSSDVLRWLANN